MPTVDKVELPRPLKTGSEADVLWSMVEHYRAAALVKCEGLSDDDLRRRSVPPSSLTLLGLVRHLTVVERYWFQEVFLGLDPEPLYASEDDPDADFNDLDSSPAPDVVAGYLAECDASRAVAAAHRLDDLARSVDRGDVSLRFIGVHMVDEYARHCGHADLLREAIDGTTGD